MNGIFTSQKIDRKNMVIYSKYLNEIKLQSVCVFLAFSFLFFFYFICFIFLGLRGLTPSLHSLPELFSESSITILKTSNLSATSFSISSTFKKSLFSLSKSVSYPLVGGLTMTACTIDCIKLFFCNVTACTS